MEASRWASPIRHHSSFATLYKLSLLEALAFLPTHLLLSYTFMYLLIPRFLLKGRYSEFLLGLAATIFIASSLSFFISDTLVVMIRDYFRVTKPSSSFYFGLMAGLRGGLSIAGFVGAIKLAKHWYNKNQLSIQLEGEKLKAELQLLKAQVHPHFLFNTLNNLYSLTLVHSAIAPEVVLKLSGLLQYMLYECNVTKVPLSKEIGMLQDYLELERLRYGERLDLSVNIEGNLEGKLIAPLLLLPFLENSFKHGASEQLDQAWVSLDIMVRGHTLKFKIMNAVPEADPPGEHQVTHGIGLANVRKRLELLYPATHELNIWRESETFLVTLTLQLEESDMEKASAETRMTFRRSAEKQLYH
ncbi:sensor histidine kinase [Rufibacter tibetensis]|uniref:sensor histidine kinase n=1 Tax=Rufibacter tibetensis TaxID=512763 RepID=UPI001FDFD097|nr:histidine kinase [Rufibacter tibetensis]